MSVRITNQKAFDLSLQKLATKLEADLGQVVRKVGFDVFRGVVERTPVDTGWARSSWNIAFGFKDATVPPKPSGDSAAFEASNQKHQEKLKLYPKDFPVIWITNALPYIVPLENGHSKQMGKGFMVQRTVAHTVAVINEALKQLK